MNWKNQILKALPSRTFKVTLPLVTRTLYLPLIRKIRGHESKGDQQIPAIAVESAWNPEVSSTTVEEAGFQLFMSRPIDIDELIRAIVSLTE